jgi:putative intracellular protease/amidase
MPGSRVILWSALLAIACLVLWPGPLHAMAADKVLIVVSGEGRDGGRTRPGYEFDELAQAWLILGANGFEVEVASPLGGAVEADKYNAGDAFNAALLANPDAMRRLAATRRIADLVAADYAAVYVVGGKGAMFDLPRDAALAALLAEVYDNGGIVAAVCHGPAALAEVRLRDGEFLVAGRAMTGFSNEEEAIFGKTWAKEFPWLLEDAMRSRGARWQEAPLMMPKVVVDGRLITGQNPYSTPALAEAIVGAASGPSGGSEPQRGELTMALVERLLAGDGEGAAAALAQDASRFHVELIGMLGYYQALAASDDRALRDALRVMELAMPYMAQPQLMLGAAEAHLKLGQRAQARTLVLQALEARSDLEQARQLLQRIDD